MPTVACGVGVRDGVWIVRVGAPRLCEVGWGWVRCVSDFTLPRIVAPCQYIMPPLDKVLSSVVYCIQVRARL